MEATFKPVAWIARIADSLPGPGPLTKTSTSCIPIAMAALMAFLACQHATKGVLFREPLKPAEPALPQATVFPCGSVIVTIVLLNVALICTCPEDSVRLVFLAPPRRDDRAVLAIKPSYWNSYPPDCRTEGRTPIR